MATTEERLRRLISENLEVGGQPLSADLDLNSSLMEAGVTSMELVAFARVIQEEFQIKFEPEQCEMQNLAQVIEFLDSQSG